MRMKIKDYKPEQPPNLLIPIGLVAVLGTAIAIKDYWDNPDASEFTNGLDVNEMFCKAPEFGEEIDLFEDPFGRLTLMSSAVYTGFWHAEQADHKIVNFEFDYNRTTTNRNLEFFDYIPQDVIDDPNVSFILTGHSSYDLDDQLGLRNGVRAPDDFERLHYQHLKNNFAVASDRLDFIKGKLIEAGISEDRISVRNLNTRYDKRAVDLEVCMPGGANKVAEMPDEVPEV